MRTPAHRITRATEIGMAYLLVPGEAQKQYALEAILTLLTGEDNVKAFREHYNRENQWTQGTPQ